MPKTLFLFFLLFPFAAISQVSISGRVISQADTKPVADASVFISNATIGDRTAVDGKFTLKNLRPGKYELVVSLVGFDAYTQNITVEDKDISLPDITIYPKTIALGEVKVKANRDPDRQRNYDWFKDEFLGKSELAKETKIINPELLDLQYDERNGILKGSSVDFLIIENRALGYRMKYLLSDFMLNNYDEKDKSFSYAGSVLFEKMKGTADEEEQWKARRQEVYEGSQLHFLRSALNNKLEQEGFRVLRVAITKNPNRPADSLINENIRVYSLLQNEKGKNSYKDSLAYWVKKAKLPAILHARLLTDPLTKADVVKSGRQRGLFELTPGGNDAIFVTYDKYHHFNTGAYSHLSDADNKASTVISFNEPAAYFDKNGAVINPRSLSYEGVWSRNRVASLLPVDYEPSGDNTIEVDTVLVNNISNKFNSYAASHLTEKTYLHFDKPYYAAGDTIYFKAYVMTGDTHQLSRQGGVLYAELISPDNQIKNSIKLPLNDGVAWADFALADTLKKGNYRVRAYTNLMRNGGEAGFFECMIPIGSATNPRIPEATISQTPTKGNPAIQFFPESGSLLTGVRSKVAFKAINANGMGIDVKGVITDQNNKEVSIFASSHLGMGYFYITPEANKAYKAKLNYADGSQADIDLPKSESNGISIEVSAQSRLYTIKISSSKTYYQNNKNKTYTLVTCYGKTLNSVSCKLDKPDLTVTLPNKDMPTGIAKVALFSASGEPLCERLLFVQNDDPKPGISSDKTVYNKREKVTLKLNAASGHYSVSVTDADKVQVDENTESTIVNNLLLTSELKGYIEQPNYYFNAPSEKTKADIDLVMLTHGYRRFEWKEILNESNDKKAPIAYQPETGLSITGMVMAHGKPVVNGKVKLFTRSGGSLMLDTTTDAKGRFVFDRLTYSDSTKFVIQARTATGLKDVDVIPDKITQPPAISNEINPAIPKDDRGLIDYTQNSKQFNDEQKKYGINQHVKMLEEVVIKEKKKDPLLAHSENLNGAGNADQVITSKDLENSGYSTLYDVLSAKANNIQITKEHYLKSRHSQNDFSGSVDLMEIIVDGIPMQQQFGVRKDEPKPIDVISVDDIESIEIGLGANYGALYGSRGAGGVLIITTKRAKKANNYYREAPGVIVYKSNGFYKAREFYSPQYDNPKTNQKMADLRSTIYWQPNITTDKDGKASFSYFNADGKGTYRVVVEGIDADGNLGRQVYRYKVE